MSATNRGAERKQFDLYETPATAIQSFLESFKFPENSYICDPCSATGSIIRTTKQYQPNLNWSANEIDAKHEPALMELGIPYLTKDFLKLTTDDVKYLTNGKEKFDYIFTNPPYSMALEFIKRSLDISQNVIMLLRLNFLSSKKRSAFLRTRVPNVYVLSKRPSFINGTTDATEYAWFFWDSNSLKDVGNLHILGA